MYEKIDEEKEKLTYHSILTGVESKVPIIRYKTLDKGTCTKIAFARAPHREKKRQKEKKKIKEKKRKGKKKRPSHPTPIIYMSVFEW